MSGAAAGEAREAGVARLGAVAVVSIDLYSQTRQQVSNNMLTRRLKDFKASELGGIAGKAALAELPQGVEVDQVFFG